MADLSASQNMVGGMPPRQRRQKAGHQLDIFSFPVRDTRVLLSHGYSLQQLMSCGAAVCDCVLA